MLIKYRLGQNDIFRFPKYNPDRTEEKKFISGFNRYKLPSVQSILENSTWDYRHEYIRRVCFPMISKETVKALAKELRGKRVLELGAGSGILAHHLEKHGVNIVTVDNGSWGGKWKVYHRTITDDAMNYFNKNKKKFDVIIMSWPNYEQPLAYKIAKRLSANHELIYQGEAYGGCTADDNFHRLWDDRMIDDKKFNARMEKVNIRFDGIHDSWYKLKRRL